MAEYPVPEFLTDLVINVTHANGVFRLTLGQQDANNQVRAVARILIPAGQLGPILQGVNKGAADIMARVQAQAQERSQGKTQGSQQRSHAEESKGASKN